MKLLFPEVVELKGRDHILLGLKDNVFAECIKMLMGRSYFWDYV
jgi:hypothetical protein